MLPIALTMLVIVITAAAVVLYVAYPHRGEQVPGAPWLGQAMGKAVDKLPLIDEQERDTLRR